MTGRSRARVRSAIVAATVALAGAGVVALSAPAGAATVTDEASLRAAWEGTATQIDMAANIDLTCGGGSSLERNSTDPVTLDGHGFTLRQTCTTGGDNNVLIQNGTGAVTVTNLTVTGGNTDGSGGGIFAIGPLVLTNAVITGNRAIHFGGGIASDATVTLTNSTISNNSVSSGGGAGIAGNGLVRLVGSTVSGNNGGGVSNNGANPIEIVNSTVAKNTAGLAAGVFTEGTVTLVYATIAQNTASQAFDNLEAHELIAFGSVIGDAHVGGDNCLVTIGSSNGHNLVTDDSCKLTASTDIVGGATGLSTTLENLGGPTQVLTPLPGTRLIDAIPLGACRDDGATGITTDQRGVSRPQGPGCDIGAVEVEVPGPGPGPGPAPAAPVAAVVRFTG